MKIYRIDADSNMGEHFMFKWFKDDFVHDRDFLFKFSITNKSLMKHLQEPSCEKIIDATSKTYANFSRFMGVSVNFIVDKTTCDLLATFNQNLEFIPITCEGNTYYLLYVMEFAEYDLSKIIRESTIILADSRTGKKIPVPMMTRVKKFAFKQEDLTDKHIFRTILDGAYKSEIFVSEHFKQTILNNNLTGFKFIEVWDSNND